MTVLEMQTQHDNAIGKADGILAAAERQKRQLTNFEQQAIDASLKEVADLKPRIAAAKPTATRSTAEIRALLGKTPRLTHIERNHEPGREAIMPNRFSRDYFESFWSRLSGRGPLTAALQEGINNAGGYAVPVTVDGVIVPLAPSDFAVRALATVMTTTSDRKVAQVATLPTASQKSEGSAFGASTSTLGQFTLGSNIVGVEWDGSIEAFDDIPLYTVTALRDSTSSLQILEEGKFLTGSGNGEPQGLLGNIDTGVASATADGAGNLLSIDATFDILGTLKGAYHPNASWVMQRASGIELRKAQKQSALFQPVFTRFNGQDFLHGYPVYYSDSMPAIAAGATPAIFGDVKSAYLIGDRGGSAVSMKVLDQTKVLQGLITVLIYRRTDGRVRCPEALKALTLHT